MTGIHSPKVVTVLRWRAVRAQNILDSSSRSVRKFHQLDTHCYQTINHWIIELKKQVQFRLRMMLKSVISLLY